MRKKEQVAPPDLLKKLGIMNLAPDFKVTITLAHALAKGLTFVPTPKQMNHEDIQSGIKRFTRSLKIKHSFIKFHGQVREKRFQIPSKYEPPIGSFPPEIQELEIILKQASRKLPKENRDPYNLSGPEHRSLKALAENTSIIVKPADKGCGIVLMSREHYVHEAMKQLAVQKHYQEIEEPLFPKICDKYNEILKEMRALRLITPREQQYLTAIPDSRERIFYLLPKIHKAPEKWSVPHIIPPGRPIVSDVNSESYNIARFIDFHLAPYAVSFPAYVKNTYDFLLKLSQVQTQESSLLISLDVDSLYTNIDNEMGLRAVKAAFATNPKPIHEYILKLLKVSLETNDFGFNGKHYLQKDGVAMGRRYSPSFANLTMALWEKENLPKCDKQPDIYLRYLDDIFLIWNHSRQDFEKFFHTLNTAHPNVKLKANVQKQEIEFLDVLIYKGQRFKQGGTLDTKVYFKPTDSHALLHKHSYHPKHTFKGIIKSQMIRFGRISNHKEDFNEACKILFSTLTTRAYSRSFLRSIKQSVEAQFFPAPQITGMKPCGSNRCSICPHVLQNTHLQTPTGHLRLFAAGNCNTKDAVYALGCRKCPGLIYVGQTTNLRERFLNHRSTMKRGDSTLLALHFFNIHNTQDVFITILECPPPNKQGDRAHLEKMERDWIRRLDSYQSGLNTDPGVPADITPLIMPHGPASKLLTKVCRTWLDDFYSKNPNLKPCNLIQANSRNKNLAQMLTKSLLKPLTE